MRYFSNLPTINYYFSDEDVYVKMRNIFYHLDIKFEFNDIMQFYRIKDNQNIEYISYELYGTTDYWWLIAIMNDIKDIIFDLPLSEYVLKSIANKETLLIYDNLSVDGALDYYNSVFDNLVIENDEKRVIKVIKPDKLMYVIDKINRVMS